MKGTKINRFIVVFILIVSMSGQKEPQVLNTKLGTSTQIQMAQGTSEIFKIHIEDQVGEKTKLYFWVQYTDQILPLAPLVSVSKQDSNFTMDCDQLHNQFATICIIPPEEVNQNQTFMFNVYSQFSGTIQINPSITQHLELPMDEEIQFRESTQQEQIRIAIPQDSNFTEIVIMGKINNANSREFTQGFQIFINVGSLGQQMPTVKNYTFKGQKLWGDKIGTSISQKQLENATWIKILLIKPKQMIVSLVAKLVDDNKFKIRLQQQVKDTIPAIYQRYYQLDLTNVYEAIKDEIINVRMQIFSGSPKIHILYNYILQQIPESLEVKHNFGRVNFEVTPQMRESGNFSGYLYIRVQASFQESVSYFLQVSVAREKVILLKLDMTQMSLIVTQNEIKNYVYTERLIFKKNATKQQKKISYIAKIDVQQGDVAFGMRLCINADDQSLIGECAIQRNDLKSKQISDSFETSEIQVEKFSNVYYLKFQIDMNNCLEQQISSFRQDQSVYICFFHFIAYLSNAQTSGRYAFTLSRLNQIFGLKEGRQQRSTVDKQSYQFFKFDLPNDIRVIKQVVCILTTIQGDPVMLASNVTKYPELKDISDTKKFVIVASQSKVVFNSSSFNASQNLYFSVYGHQKSDFTIAILVKKRSDLRPNQTITNSIILKQSTIMNYTLKTSQQKVSFLLQTTPKNNYGLQINQAVGHTQLELSSKNKQTGKTKSICEKGASNYCSFEAALNEQYLATVFGELKQSQVFTVIFYQNVAESCLQYPISHPVYFTIDSSNEICLEYIIRQVKQIDITISMSTLDFLNTKTTSEIHINEDKIYMQGKRRTISATLIQKYCRNKEGNFTSCAIRIKLKTQNSIQIGIMVSQVGKEIVLFDGIEQSFQWYSMSNEGFKKYFSFYIYNKQRPAKIMFISEQYQYFQIGTILMNQTEYLTNTQSIENLYPGVGQFHQKNDIQNKSIIIQKIEGRFSIISIDPQEILATNCTSCVLLIGVFGKQITPSEQITDIKFKIEVTQKFAQIQLGHSKIGFVDKGQIVQYDISMDKIANGIVTVTSLHNDQCFNIYAVDSKNANLKKQLIHQNYVQLTNESRLYKVSIEGSEECSYSIGFYNFEKPVMEIYRGVYYEVDLQAGQVKYFLYKHQYRESFRVVQMVRAGKVNLFVTPLLYSDNLNEFLKKQLADFRFNQTNVDVQSGKIDSIFIEKYNPSACIDCYYLIAAQANQAAKQQIMVLWQTDNIILKQNIVFSDQISVSASKLSPLPNQDKAPNTPATYQFNSVTDFKILINVIQGNVSAMITKDSIEGKLLAFEQNIIGSKQIQIKLPQQTVNGAFLIEDQSRFQLDIYPNTQSYYTLTLVKQSLILPLNAGNPRIFEFIQGNIQFKFTNRQQQTDITLIIEIATELSIQSNDIQISAKAVNIDNELQSSEQKNIIIETTKSGSNFNIRMKPFYADYIIKLSNKRSQLKNVTGHAVLIDQNLTHLLPSRDNLFTTKGIYQLYSNNKSILIEIYTCKGDIIVQGFKNYPDFSDKYDGELATNSPKIEQSSYGGHYVITTTPQNGAFYLDVDNIDQSEKQQLIYTINYYQFDEYSNNPYQRFYTESENIAFNARKSKYQFSLYPYLQRKSAYLPSKFKRQHAQMLNLTKIKYTIFFGFSEETVRQAIQCQLETSSIIKDSTTVQGSQLADGKRVNISLDYTIIDQFLKKGPQGQDTAKFFVAARADLYIQQPQQNHFSLSYLEYAYNTVQMDRQHSKSIGEGPAVKESDTVVKILILIVIPFMIGSILLFFSFRFCLRQWMMLRPLSLQQDDPLAQSQEGMTSQAQHQEIK